MIWKRDKFWGGSEKQSALELRGCWAADCSRGGFQPSETHDRQQWTAVFVGSPAVRMTMTRNGGGWNRRHAGCSQKDTVQALVNEHRQLEINVFRWPQPVKVSQHWCDVLIPRRSMCQSGGGDEHRRKLIDLVRRRSCECCIAVVEMWHNQQHDQQMEHRIGHWTSDAAKLS